MRGPDERTSDMFSYVSPEARVFGWMKTVGGLRKLRHCGRELVDWTITFTAAAYNLVRMRNLART
jgi:hypothetical protein